MKTLSFSVRNVKEILRDPLNLGFGLGFPLILLFLLSMIQRNIPVEMFAIESLVPGVAVFGLSFISLFSALTIAKDRSGSFILRLFTSPMRAVDFLVGYTLPMLPLALGQTCVCYLAACCLGLRPTVHMLAAIAAALPTAVLFIAIGLLCGACFNDKQVGGVCGALLTNVSAWLSGTWFDIALVGGVFQAIAECLPFFHAVQAGRYALAGNYAGMWPELLWVGGYAVVCFAAAVFVFMRKMYADRL